MERLLQKIKLRIDRAYLYAARKKGSLVR